MDGKIIVISHDRYFEVNPTSFKEIGFDDAFGRGFFDWTHGICIATNQEKEAYTQARTNGVCSKICQKISEAVR